MGGTSLRVLRRGGDKVCDAFTTTVIPPQGGIYTQHGFTMTPASSNAFGAKERRTWQFATDVVDDQLEGKLLWGSVRVGTDEFRRVP